MRPKCRNELKKWPQVYLPPQFQRANPDKSGISEPSSPSPLHNQIGTPHLPSGWYWTEHEKVEPEDVIERQFLYDRDGRLAARIAQDGEGWWVVYPRVTPEPPIEPLDAAMRRAETVALWALPLDRATAKNMRAAWRDRPPDNPNRGESAGIQSRWEPSRALRDLDSFPIPDFLKRSAP